MTTELPLHPLAAAWLALAQAFAPPREWDRDLEARLEAAASGLDADARAAFLRLAEQIGAARADRERAEIAHARLFIGPYDVRAPIYASLYLDPERRIMGAVSQRVARWYAEAGLEPGAGPRDAPDHVETELEFMYFLHFEEARTGEQRWAELRRHFWSEHAQPWLGQLLGLLKTQRGLHPVYRALTDALEQVMTREDASD